MVTKQMFFDGAMKASINSLPDEAWRIITGNSDAAADIVTIYKTVPFFYRTVDIRAQAVSAMPRDILRNGEPIDETTIPLLANLSTWLYQIETAQLLFGAAYLFKSPNRAGLPQVRWLAPQSVTPKIKEDEGLVGFLRAIGSRSQQLTIEEVVYFWQPQIINDVGPGLPPGKVALDSAGVLSGTVQFSSQFFKRGAVFPMLLTVDGNPPQAELQKLETWWKRMLRGVKDAWETVAVKASVKQSEVNPPPVEDIEDADYVTVDEDGVIQEELEPPM